MNETIEKIVCGFCVVAGVVAGLSLPLSVAYLIVCLARRLAG